MDTRYGWKSLNTNAGKQSHFQIENRNNLDIGFLHRISSKQSE